VFKINLDHDIAFKPSSFFLFFSRGKYILAV
jgi:hypothetical protein